MLSACCGIVDDSSDHLCPVHFQVPSPSGVSARLWPTSTTASMTGSSASSCPCWGACGPAGRCFHLPRANVHVSSSGRLGLTEPVHGCPGAEGAGHDAWVKVSARPPNSSSPPPDASAAISADDLAGGAVVATDCHRSPAHCQVRADCAVRGPRPCWPPNAITLWLPGS